METTAQVEMILWLYQAYEARPTQSEVMRLVTKQPSMAAGQDAAVTDRLNELIRDLLRRPGAAEGSDTAA